MGQDPNVIPVANQESIQYIASHEIKFIGNRIVLEFLNTEEAAVFLGVSADALRIRVNRNQIRAYYFGRRLRFRVEELRQALQQKENLCR